MSQYLLIAIAVLVALLAATGALLKSSWETNAQLELQYAAQQAETQKAIQQINDIKLEHQNQIHAMDNQLEDIRRAKTELTKNNKRIQATTSTLEKALKREPIRAGRAATYLNARGLRDLCRASGGTAADCKISLPKPPAAKPSNPASSRDGATKILAK